MNYKESLKIIVEAIENLDKLRDYFEDNDYKNAWSGPWPRNWEDRNSKDGYVVLYTYAGEIIYKMEDIFESVNLRSEAESLYESFSDVLDNDLREAGGNDLDDLTLGDLKNTLDWVDELIIFLEKTEKLLEEKISLEENFVSITQDSLNDLYIAYEKGNKAKDNLDQEARYLLKESVSDVIGGSSGKGYSSFTYIGSFYESLFYLRRNSKYGLRKVIDSDVYEDLNDVLDQIIDNGDLEFERERVALRWLEGWYDNAVEVVEEIIDQLESQL